MKTKCYLLLSMLFISFIAFGQASYLDKNNQEHLWGKIQLDDLQEAPYQEWFTSNYDAFQPDLGEEFPRTNLQDTEVTIFLGTWCGDSKLWVPRFIKLWDELGLDRNQLHFVALHNKSAVYKQGLDGEEKGLNIHRVPTFIFEQNDQEIARIVESPLNSMEADLAQISLGFPSTPRYRGANYLSTLYAEVPLDSLTQHFRPALRKIYREVHTSSELNTFGYVLKAAGREREALFAFQLNAWLFKHHPNVHDSLGEMYFDLKDYKQARNSYEQVLKLEADNENAREMLGKIEEALAAK